MNKITDIIFQIGTVATFITIAIIGGLVILGVIGFTAWLKFSDLRRVYKQKVVFIEVTPPLEASKTPEATEQLLHVLHGIGTTKSFRNKILCRSIVFSLEVVSSRREGVRYIIRTDEAHVKSVERSITSFLSNARVARIDDPLFKKTATSKVTEFKQTRHFAFPIRTLETFEQHDTIAYITGAMNRLGENEQVALQIVISPARVRNMAKIVQRYHEFYKVSEATHNKAYSQLFRTELRIRVVSTNKSGLDELISGLEAAIIAMSIPKVQTLKARYNFPAAVRGRYREWAFTHRLPSIAFKHSSILSSLEIASLYHLPADRTNNEGVVKSLSRTLAPPLSIRNNQAFDFVLGETNHHGEKQLVGLTEKEREKHMYIVGGTGNGKTTMMQNAIVNDIKNGKGVAVIDPHGDMAEELLRHIPEKRMKDVIYFNPKDLDHPIGFNPLEISAELTGTALLDERERVCEALVSTLRKVFSDDDTGGSRIEAMLRNAIHTAFEAENPTLFTIYDLINDDKFRNKIVPKLENEHLKKFWLNEFGKAGGMQQVKIAFGITTKIGRFLFSESAKRVFGQSKSTINFSQIMDEGKILICNFSKSIGDDTSSLFGIVTLSQLQLAALKRAELKKNDRRPFYVYVDEFQNFATPSFEQILSQARKYHMHMIMAEQSIQQQDSKMIGTMLNNLGSVVVFRSGNPADEATLLPLFDPFLGRGEISNLPTFNFFARLSAVKTQEPISGTTIVIEDDGSDEVAEHVIESSRKLYTGKIPVITSSQAPQATSEPKTTNHASSMESDENSLVSPQNEEPLLSDQNY